MAKKIKGAKVIETLNNNIVILIPRMGEGGKQNNFIICISPTGEYRPWGCEKEGGYKMSEGHLSNIYDKNIGFRPATTTEIEFAEKAEIIREEFLKLPYAERFIWDGFRPVPKKTEKEVKPTGQKISEKPFNQERLKSLKERMKRDELIAK